MITRLAAGVEYVGTNFYGFQSQKDLRTVQGELERALAKVADEKVKVVCSGRTDSGVHALEQIIHFDTSKKRSSKEWLFGTNRYLPADVNLVWIAEANNDFHARFDAIARQYKYLIYNSPVRSALKKDKYLWEPRGLDLVNMKQASNYLVGKHDFKSFQDSQCQAKSSIKTIEFLNINKVGDEIIIDIKANAFLHHMVRNIVGTLLKIGYRDKPPEWMLDVLLQKDRTVAGMTVLPQGLYFVKAFYSEKFKLQQFN